MCKWEDKWLQSVCIKLHLENDICTWTPVSATKLLSYKLPHSIIIIIISIITENWNQLEHDVWRQDVHKFAVFKGSQSQLGSHVVDVNDE